MKRWVIIFLLLLPVVAAQAEDYNRYDTLTVDVSVSSGIEKQDGQIQEISADLGFYPKEFAHQSILSEQFLSTPLASTTKTASTVLFSWEEDSTSYSYSSSSRVQTENDLVQIRAKVPYPTSADEAVAPYTLATDIIDITPEMSSLAEELIGGEDDLYTVVYILANWTQQNIAYNLSTLNVDAVQTSSWVLEHREGVCDELTNLFISLARSQGIPARFVSGIVYSNVNYDFGAHGWAEVYIDGQWIPVDVTFGTFGWIDPSHIKFQDELTSTEASVEYQWIGNDVAIDVDEVSVHGTLIDAEGVADTYVDVEIEALKDSVGPGSYVPVQITVTNPNSFYVPVQLHITKAPSVVGSNAKSILLTPHEERSVFWIVRVPEDIEYNFLYTTVLEVKTMYGGSASSDMFYAQGYEVMTQAESERVIGSLTVSEEKPYLDDVSVSCSTDKDLYYSTESATVLCVLGGNYQGADVCFQGDCVSAAPELTWSIDLSGQMSQRLLVSAEKDGKARYSYFDLQIVEIPSVTIENVEPQSLDFSDPVNLTFDIVSTSLVKNLEVSVERLGTFRIASLSGAKRIEVPVTGKNLFLEDITFSLHYSDELGRMYDSEQTVHVTVRNIPWYYKILRSILQLF